jgi:DNA-binding NarL/FixJ family response regulator
VKDQSIVPDSVTLSKRTGEIFWSSCGRASCQILGNVQRLVYSPKKSQMPMEILVADDHIAVAESFQVLLQPQGWHVRVAHSPEAVDALLMTWTPDIALLDLEFRGSDRTGFDIAHLIGRMRLSTRVIFLSMHNDAVFPEYARKEGAAGFLVKSSPSTDVIEAIRIVSAGGTWFPPPANRRQHHGLPDQERRVIQHLARGLRDKEIARAMGIEPRTVLYHIHRAEKLTDAKTRIELLRMYYERALNLLPLRPPPGDKPKHDDD